MFLSVRQTMLAHQEEFNRLDTYNSNHGDHMLAVFDVSTQAIRGSLDASLAGNMQRVAERLAALEDNDSARVYAAGLAQFASQFERYQVTVKDLVAHVRSLVREDTDAGSPLSMKSLASSGDVLKAMVNGLAGWNHSLRTDNGDSGRLDMGYLFELGIIYMQAKQRNRDRLDVLADAAVSASPLSQIPYRYQSGKVAIRALLESLSSATNGPRTQ